ncbi:MAG TPA: PIN domain-containing protein [Stellaceae bacterium]|nr:PIN domain-containing protein [Stellaceae bacterium]
MRISAIGEVPHDWAVREFANLATPILTCEPVLTETCFLLHRARVPAARLLSKIEPGGLQIAIRLADEIGAISRLMHRYRDLPMALADACLVRLAEISGLPICTLDSDFAIYRAGRRSRLSLISP